MVFLFVWLFFGLIGAALGQRKQIGCAGLLLGVLFGPIGCLLVLFMHGKAKKCPRCGEIVRPEATVCRYCQTDLSGVDNPETDFSLGRVGMSIFIFGVLPLGAYKGWEYFNDQKKEHERAASFTPTPVPVARLAAVPTPTPSFQDGVARSQRAAVARYPELGVPGSPRNRKYLARYNVWKAQGDIRLTRPDWPEKLAEDCATTP